jgi:hypothetical protein
MTFSLRPPRRENERAIIKEDHFLNLAWMHIQYNATIFARTMFFGLPLIGTITNQQSELNKFGYRNKVVPDNQIVIKLGKLY